MNEDSAARRPQWRKPNNTFLKRGRSLRHRQEDDSLREIAQTLGPTAKITNARIEQILLRARSGDAAAIEEIIKHVQYFSLWHARRMSFRRLPYADLVQEGLLGVLEAMRRIDTSYDPGQTLRAFLTDSAKYSQRNAASRYDYRYPCRFPPGWFRLNRADADMSVREILEDTALTEKRKRRKIAKLHSLLIFLWSETISLQAILAPVPEDILIFTDEENRQRQQSTEEKLGLLYHPGLTTFEIAHLESLAKEFIAALRRAIRALYPRPDLQRSLAMVWGLEGFPLIPIEAISCRAKRRTTSLRNLEIRAQRKILEVPRRAENGDFENKTRIADSKVRDRRGLMHMLWRLAYEQEGENLFGEHGRCTDRGLYEGLCDFLETFLVAAKDYWRRKEQNEAPLLTLDTLPDMEMNEAACERILGQCKTLTKPSKRKNGGLWLVIDDIERRLWTQLGLKPKEAEAFVSWGKQNDRLRRTRWGRMRLLPSPEQLKSLLQDLWLQADYVGREGLLRGAGDRRRVGPRQRHLFLLTRLHELGAITWDGELTDQTVVRLLRKRLP